jgi:hypothetical protein
MSQISKHRQLEDFNLQLPMYFDREMAADKALESAITTRAEARSRIR